MRIPGNGIPYFYGVRQIQTNSSGKLTAHTSFISCSLIHSVLLKSTPTSPAACKFAFASRISRSVIKSLIRPKAFRSISSVKLWSWTILRIASTVQCSSAIDLRAWELPYFCWRETNPSNTWGVRWPPFLPTSQSLVSTTWHDNNTSFKTDQSPLNLFGDVPLAGALKSMLNHVQKSLASNITAFKGSSVTEALSPTACDRW